ncbi:MAG: hypothetical protein ACPGYV_00055 [Phycisphaeraceae bacterium]
MTRRVALLLAASSIAMGCQQSRRISIDELKQRYQDTVFADGVLSIVPLRLEPDSDPPVIVNWAYAGTKANEHHVVMRRLTWDDEQRPVGVEARYRIAASDLTIRETIEQTDWFDAWVPLYEAALSPAFDPPPDLPTSRRPPGPATETPIVPATSSSFESTPATSEPVPTEAD